MKLPLKERARQLWHTVLHVHATPGEIAGGFALGIFVSFLPIIPFRTIVALVLSWLLRRNVVAALAGKSITLLYTPLVPLLWLVEFRLGSVFLTVDLPADLRQAHLGEILHMGWEALAATFIGGVILGLPAALAAYLIARRAANRWAARHR